MYRYRKDPCSLQSPSARSTQLGRAFSLIIPLLICLSFLGCLPKKPVVTPVEELGTAELQQRAQAAWDRSEYQQAEQLYLKLVNRPEITRGQKVTAWRRASISAVESNHFQVADKALQGWAGIDTSARETWTWHRLKAKVLKGTGRLKAYEGHLRSLLDPQWSWFIGLRAATMLSRDLLERQKFKDLFALQTELYGLAKDRDLKRQAESNFLQLLRDAEAAAILSAARKVPKDKWFQFPYCLVRWEETIRRFQSRELEWEQAWERLAGIIEQARLTGTEPLRQRLDELIKDYGRPRVHLALLVPLSGGYADLGQSIARGADIAQWQMTQRDMEVRVRLVNTDSEHWLQLLRDLPQSYDLVGGPIRHSVWQALYSSGQTEKRTVFAFRSSLQPGAEGQDGYRFFPSTKDQVRPLVEMVHGALEVERFGTLYPRSEYGRKMAEAFWEQVVYEGCQLAGLDWYLPGEHTGWKERVAGFLHVPEEILREKKDSLEKPEQKKKDKEPTIPDPDFQAVFLPDSFSQARILIPEFFYFNQNDLLFLGPALWSQDVQSISELDQQYYKLALMTGGWWPQNPAPAVEKLKLGLDSTAQGDPEFWVALGYDFVRFGYHLAQSLEGGDPERINPLLADMAGFEWSMAPLKWNREGKARQDLFVLQPSNQGVRRAHIQLIRHRLTALRERKEALRNATQGNKSDRLKPGAGHENQPAGSGQNRRSGQTSAQ